MTKRVTGQSIYARNRSFPVCRRGRSLSRFTCYVLPFFPSSLGIIIYLNEGILLICSHALFLSSTTKYIRYNWMTARKFSSFSIQWFNFGMTLRSKVHINFVTRNQVSLPNLILEKQLQEQLKLKMLIMAKLYL